MENIEINNKTRILLKNNILDESRYRNIESFLNWHQKVMNTLCNMYTKEDERAISFNLLKYKFKKPYKSTILEDVNITATAILSGIIEDVSIFGIPNMNNNQNNNQNDNKSTSTIDFKPVIQLSQQQSQQQSQEVEILLKTIFKAVDSKLTGDQREELKAILDSPDSEEAKKLQFVGKIKSFGADVASGILATLLTNPAVYSGIANMF